MNHQLHMFNHVHIMFSGSNGVRYGVGCHIRSRMGHISSLWRSGVEEISLAPSTVESSWIHMEPYRATWGAVWSHQHSGYWNLAPVDLRSSARLWPRSCATSSSVAVHLRNIASEIHKIHRRGTVRVMQQKAASKYHQRIPNRSTLKMPNVGQSPVMTKWPVLILRTCYNFNCLARGASRFWRLLGRDGNGGTWPHYGNCQTSKTCQVTLILCDTMPYHATPICPKPARAPGPCAWFAPMWMP